MHLIFIFKGNFSWRDNTCISLVRPR